MKNDTLQKFVNYINCLKNESCYKEYVFEKYIEISEQFGSDLKKFDFTTETAEICYYDSEEDEMGISIFTMQNEISSVLDKCVREIISSTDLAFTSALLSGGSISLVIKDIEGLLLPFLTKPYHLENVKMLVKSAIQNLFRHFEDRYSYHSSIDFENEIILDPLSPTNSDSFNWISVSHSVKEQTLRKLYNALVQEPPIISGNEEDFIKAFTGRKISQGIKWLVKGKNGQYSKISLIRFLEYLFDQGFVARKTPSDLNYAIKYIFRDNNGTDIKNISQSKSSDSYKSSQFTRIQSIIDSLNK